MCCIIFSVNAEDATIEYHSFRELVAAWHQDDRPALLEMQDESLHAVSRAALAGMIECEAEALRLTASSRELVIADHTPAAIVRIFANALAGRTSILSDPSLDPEIIALQMQAAGADSVYAEDESLRQELPPCCCPPSASSREEEGDLVFFTSGTGSLQKGAVLSSSSLCCSAWNGQSMLACGPQDIILCLLPLSHVFGFVCGLLWGLAYGSAIALGRGRRHLLDDCSTFAPTILPAVPSLAAALLHAGALNEQLRVVLIGAAPCPEQLAEEMRQRQIDIRDGYGLTETASGLAIAESSADPSLLSLCPDTRIRIAEDGELWVKTPCLMKGYLKEPSPLVDGWLPTGDLCRAEGDRKIRIIGRRKAMLVLKDGTKIWCPEYEEEMSRLLNGAETAMILEQDLPTLIIHGSVTDEMAARAAAQFNAHRPRSQQIAQWKLRSEPLPRTATGKLQRWILEKEGEAE